MCLGRYLHQVAADPHAITALLAQLPPDVAAFMQSQDFVGGCTAKFADLLEPGEPNLSSKAASGLLRTHPHASSKV
jgi:hypothetical protein